MRRRTKALVVVAVILVGFTTASVLFVLLPVEPALGPCAGGSACVKDYFPSCLLLGFGGYADFYGGYYFTSNCSGFVNH